MMKLLRHAAIASLVVMYVATPVGAWAMTSPQSKFVLISDVDDTIRVSHVDSFANKVIRFFSDPVAFAGMSELYGEMLRAATTRGLESNFIVLSGTPTFFESSVLEFLDIFRFPEALRVITRPLMDNTETYKSAEVLEMVKDPGMKGASIVMVGDDTQHDLAAYKMAAAVPGGFESQIYIRRASGVAKTTRTSIAFDSAADIAIVEFLKGRLSRVATERIFAIVLGEARAEHLFVPGEYCPTFRSARLSDYLKAATVDSDLLRKFIGVEDHLREICELNLY